MKNKLKIYGFTIGERSIRIMASEEKEATVFLIGEYWDLIKKSGKIELLGESKTQNINTKIESLDESETLNVNEKC